MYTMNKTIIKEPIKVLLIDPPQRKHIIWDPIHKSQPLSLLYLASYLINNLGRKVRVKIIDAVAEGFANRHIYNSDVFESSDLTMKDTSVQSIWNSAYKDILDLSVSKEEMLDDFIRKYSLIEKENVVRIGLSNDEIVEKVREFDPDVIGITILASVIHPTAVELAKALKIAFPHKMIIAGCAHATAMSKEVFRDSSGAIDFIVQFEGEKVLLNLINNIHNHEKIKKLNGIAYLQNNEVKWNQRESLLALKEISLINPKLLRDIEYPQIATHAANTHNRKYIDIMFSRGCHNSCDFCSTPRFWGQIRLPSIQNVEKQLDILKKAGYKELIIQDDNFTENEDWAKEVIDRIFKKGFYWQNNGGLELENLSHEIIDYMAKRNCTSVFIPVNIGRDLIDYKITENLRTKALDIFPYIKKNYQDLIVFGGGILGIPNLAQPDQTEQNILKEIDFFVTLSKKNCFDYFIIYFLSILPGTKWWGKLKNDGFWIHEGEDNWASYSNHVPQVVTSFYSYHKLCKIALKAHLLINGSEKSAKWMTLKTWSGAI